MADDDRRSQNDLLELNEVAQRAGGLIGKALETHQKQRGGAQTCFALLMFTIGEGGWSTWVSNAEREGMIEAMEEMVKKLKAGGDLH